MALEGKLVILREERREDQRLFADLRNDVDTQAWPKALPPDYTEEMHIRRLETREFTYERDSARLASSIVYPQASALSSVGSSGEPASRSTPRNSCFASYSTNLDCARPISGRTPASRRPLRSPVDPAS
jgi:hypothetical protein